MDLFAGVCRVVVVMQHRNKAHERKILKRFTLPLTGKRVVDLIITDLAVITCDKNRGLSLIELAPGMTAEEMRAKTAAEIDTATFADGAV